MKKLLVLASLLFVSGLAHAATPSSTELKAHCMVVTYDGQTAASIKRPYESDITLPADRDVEVFRSANVIYKAAFTYMEFPDNKKGTFVSTNGLHLTMSSVQTGKTFAHSFSFWDGADAASGSVDSDFAEPNLNASLTCN